MKRLPRSVRVLLIVCGGLCLALALAEGIVRLLPGPLGIPVAAISDCRRFLLTGLMKEYEPRAYTGFQRPRSGPYAGNSFGFQDVARTRERTPGVPRVLCLGGSTTEGGNPLGLTGSYPYLLEQTLEARTGRDFEVLNCGISGWTTAEMLCSWFLTLQDFHPDVLVLHEAVNDLDARFWTGFEPDYSHWRRPVQTQAVQGWTRTLAKWSNLFVLLRLRTSPAPSILSVSSYPDLPWEPLLAEGRLPHETSFPFRRNMSSMARSAAANGALVVLMTLPPRPGPMAIGEFWRYGIEENNQHLHDLAAEQGFLLADAERHFVAHPELAAQFLDVVHLEVAGNQAKAELLVATLEQPWLAGLSSEGARPPSAK
ncbi:MAG: SGNH/GDSL hydrolase family protein [Planctomycetes bacterium]|nr:SGNH/GDSL hydrolase family protein [Planctomycetota bacterium]